MLGFERDEPEQMNKLVGSGADRWDQPEETAVPI